jgi:ribosomal protein S6
MAETAVISKDTGVEDAVVRVYEIGYHILPTIAEDQLDSVVSSIRSIIETQGGTFIAEGAPALVRLSYDIETRVPVEGEGDKRVRHDRGYFGWLKFEGPTVLVAMLEEALKADPKILRHIIFQTVREETRARMKAPTLREVKRTDTIKPATHRVAEESAPVSEVDLDKALEDITQE